MTAAAADATPLGARGSLALALLGLAFGLSLFFNGLHIPLLNASGVLLVLVLAVALAPGIRDGWRLPRSPAAGWLVVWWVFLGVSLAWSTVVFTSSLYYWWLSALPLTFFALVLAPAPKAWTRRALAGLLAAAAVLAAWALVQYFALPAVYGYRAHHPLLNANNLAGLLSLALFPAVARFLLVEGQGDRARFLLLTLLLFAGVVSTQSRGALIGLAVALAVLAVFGRGLPGVNLRRLVVLGASGLAVFLVMDWWAGAGLSRRVETLGAIGSQSSFLNRLAVWEGTWHIIRDQPWLGTGLGTFFLYYPAYRLPTDTSTGGFYAHMDPLQFWAELGILGPVLFYAVLIAILVQTVRAVRHLGSDDPARLAILGPFAGLLAVAVHTHITFHLYILPILMGAGILLAAWQLACERALERPRARVALPQGAHPRVWRWLLAGVAVLVVLNLGSAGVADRMIKRGRAAVDAGEIGRALVHFHAARALAPASDTAWALGAEIRGAAMSNPELDLSQLDREALYGEAHRMLDQAMRRNPARAKLHYTRGRLYRVAPPGAEARPRERAERAWRTALAKDPRLIEARMALADLYLAADRPEEALAVLEAGLKWPYPGTRPLGLFLRTADLRDRLGDRGGAVALARRALERLPEDRARVRRALRERYLASDGGDAPEEGGHGAP